MPRNRQRGNTMVLALIVMSALATLGALTVVSVQSSLKSSTTDRSQAIALYAAESGAAITMEFLRYNFDKDPLPTPWGDPPWSRPKAWSRYVSPNNSAPYEPSATEAFGAGVMPGPPTNPFTADLNAWYTARILNNRDDLPIQYLDASVPPVPPTPPPPPPSPLYPPTPCAFVPVPAATPTRGFVDGVDYDGRVIIQVTGHGPQGSTAIVEVEVQWPIPQPVPNFPDASVCPDPPATLPYRPFQAALEPPWFAIPAPPNGPPLTLLGWHVVNL